MSTAIAKNFQIGADGTATNNFTIFQPASPDGTLRIGNGNTGITTGLVTLTSAGNLGLGVTPSAWANSKAFDIGAYGALSTDTLNDANTSLSWNAYATAYNAWKYKNTGSAASRYAQEAGKHYWYTAPSGTAGNAISFTQAMTLDASGRLGIGETSPDQMLVVKSGSAAASYIKINAPSYDTAIIGVDSSVFRIESSSTSPIAFRINGSERARITSGGLFFVGVTAQQGGGSHCIQAGTNVNALQMQNNGATPYGPYINFSAAAPNNASQYFIQCSDTAATRMLLYANGGLANYQANNANLSDRREKTNFAPAKSYLDIICAIPVQTFNYIDQNLEEDDGLTLGVVAQDVQAVAPELVMESNWGTKEDPKMRLSIYQTDLQYALMKALQELNAKVEAQAAEIAALKGQA